MTGACETRPRAEVVMYGADPTTDQFLARTIEGNIEGCAHEPPAARPDPRIPAVPKQKAKPKPSKAKDVAKAPSTWWRTRRAPASREPELPAPEPTVWPLTPAPQS